jgi:hypothetical protein
VLPLLVALCRVSGNDARHSNQPTHETASSSSLCCRFPGVILLVFTLVNRCVIDWQLHVVRPGTAGALRLLPSCCAVFTGGFTTTEPQVRTS